MWQASRQTDRQLVRLADFCVRLSLLLWTQAEKNRAAAAAAAANSLQKASYGPMRLYVGSLHFNITEDMLRGIFGPFGRVSNTHTDTQWMAVAT